MEQVNLNEAAYWLALVNNSGLKLGEIKPIAQQWHLMEGKSIAELFNLSVLELMTRFDLSDEQAQGLLKAAATHQTQLALLKKWQSQGIELLTLSHPHFPGRLAYTLPPRQQPLFLWARGNTALLTEPAITILGRPDPDPDTVAFVKALSLILEMEHIGVISGYGKGLDRLAFETMLELSEGHSLAVLPMGLAAFAKLTEKLEEPVAAGRAVLLSPFPPDTAFKDNLAEARNLLVDSLALALLVPQVDSVSLPRAEAALDRGMPVLVDMTDSPENRALIAKGAFFLTDPGEVIDMVQQAVLDDAMQTKLMKAPASETASATGGDQVPLLDGVDNYALGSEIVDPLAAEEALDILSSMGNVPDTLRARLMAIEAQQRESKSDKE